MNALELQGLLLIREKINLIKNKPHGEDVTWLIETLEMFIDEKTHPYQKGEEITNRYKHPYPMLNKIPFDSLTMFIDDGIVYWKTNEKTPTAEIIREDPFDRT